MMLLIRIVSILHLAVYAGIIWYGWRSYRLLRKQSWRYMGIGFTIFFLYRVRQMVKQIMVSYPLEAESTLIPFIGALFLLLAFRMLSKEHYSLVKLLAEPVSLRSGAQPVEYWLANFRIIVAEEGEKLLRRWFGTTPKP